MLQHELDESLLKNATQGSFAIFRNLMAWAEEGDSFALNRLAYLHFLGKGVRRSRKRTGDLWLRASAMGHARAKLNLAVCHRDGFGVRKDAAKALELYEKLANQGYYAGLTQAA